MVYLWNNLPKIKDGEYVINLDEYKSIGAHWIALYVSNNNNVTYFNSFGVERIKQLNQTIKNEAKEQKGRFYSMLLGTLGASLLGNLLTDKATIKAGEGSVRASHDFECHLNL